MKTKPYPQYTRKDIDEMAEEWLQPLTMEQINRWNEEAEEADEADDVDALIPHEIVVAKMKQFMDCIQTGCAPL